MVTMIVLILLPSAYSLGVAHSALPDDNLVMSKDSSKDFRFILQNAGDVEKKMLFKVNTMFPMVMQNDEDRFEKTYTLSANSNEEVIITFKSPSFAAKFPVYFSYQEVSDSLTGQIHIIQEVSSRFYVAVDGCISDSCLYDGLGIPLSYNLFRLITYGSDINKISDLVIMDRNDSVEIEFVGDVNLSGFKEEYVNLTYNYAYIDTDAFHAMNVSAKITFYGLNYTRQPIILKDDDPCDACEVIIFDKDDGRLKFRVDSFSEYRTVSNDSQLSTTISGEGDDDIGGQASTGSETSGDSSSSPPFDQEVPVVSGESPKSVQDLIADEKAKTEEDEAEGKVISLIDNERKEGAKKIISSLVYGFLTLFGAVGLLFVYVRDHEVEVNKMFVKDFGGTK